eukprot:gnl/MRDRNA2_/MRDRNA2_154890_c0_seq1.p1 gnl/MRDRNA2_/MRDRNA2_154890_c0~~gnl/MRDRNA2_/MRDRNA2_154890_c0_seq1.p1  ORF type:complete len:202 (-),score=40.27 gnl/MRDRNA2_/MRDRNA2_154890_c0_seq1:39-644(-)
MWSTKLTFFVLCFQAPVFGKRISELEGNAVKVQQHVMDQNSQIDLDELKLKFNQYDIDQNGSIDFEEFKAKSVKGMSFLEEHDSVKGCPADTTECSLCSTDAWCALATTHCTVCPYQSREKETCLNRGSCLNVLVTRGFEEDVLKIAESVADIRSKILKKEVGSWKGATKAKELCNEDQEACASTIQARRDAFSSVLNGLD